jgi:hypothetical protein
MKYETPELSPPTPAIYSIEGGPVGKPFGSLMEGIGYNEPMPAYEDWE